MSARMLTAAIICRECSCADGGCCRSPTPETPGFPLSPAEVDRLAAYAHLAHRPPGEGTITQIPLERVTMTAPNSPEFLEALEALLPRHKQDIAALFPADGAYRKLRTLPSGDCVFRGEAGCRLPREARPWYCNLFPMWVRGEAVMLMNPDGCRLCRKARSPVTAMRLLEMTAADVRRLFAGMLREWNLKP